MFLLQSPFLLILNFQISYELKFSCLYFGLKRCKSVTIEALDIVPHFLVTGTINSGPVSFVQSGQSKNKCENNKRKGDYHIREKDIWNIGNFCIHLSRIRCHRYQSCSFEPHVCFEVISIQHERKEVWTCRAFVLPQALV